MKLFFKRLLDAFCAIMTLIIMLLGILAALIVWKPIDTDDFAPYLSAAVESFVPGSSVSIESSSLDWDNNLYAFVFNAKNLIIVDEEGDLIAKFPSISAQIRLINILFGNFFPNRITLESPHIRIPYSESSEERESADISNIRQRIINALSKFAHARHIEISNGIIDIYDEESLNHWELKIVSAVFQRRNRNILYNEPIIHGEIKLEGPKTNFSLNLTYTFDALKMTNNLSVAFDNLIPYSILDNNPFAEKFSQLSHIKIPFSGAIDFTFDTELYLHKVSSNITGSKGELAFEGLWKDKRPIELFSFDFEFDKYSKKPAVSNILIDFGETSVSAKTEMTFAHGFLDISRSIDDNKNIVSFSSFIEIPKIAANDLGSVWAYSMGANARDWVVPNIRDGAYENGKVTIKGKLDFDDLDKSTIETLDAKINANRMTVEYMEGMPKAENVSAEAFFDINKAVINITSGNVFNINMLPFAIEITGLSEHDQHIDIPLRVSGSVPDILRLLDSPPLGYTKRMGITPADILGNAQGTVSFGFPLLRDLLIDDVDINAKADLSSIYSKALVEGIIISEGNLALDLTKEGMGLSGNVLLSGSPFNITLRENFSGSPIRTVSGSGTIAKNDWQNLFDVVSGNAALTFDLVQQNENLTSVKVSMNLSNAEIFVPMLNWRKNRSEQANLSLNIDMESGKQTAISDISLKGTNLDVSGSAVLSTGMKDIISLNFQRFMLGRNNAKISYSKNDIPLINVSGQSLDVSGFMNNDDKKEESEKTPFVGNITIKLGRLYTDEGAFLNNIEGSAIKDKFGWDKINLRMFTNSNMPLDISLLPINNSVERELLIETNDFGAALKGLGLTKTISKGKLKVSGRSTKENPRHIRGTIQIDDFTVNNMPLLGVLLNAISPFGFAGLFTNTAQFSSLRGDFGWSGDTIDLSSVRAATAAFSINTEGTVFLHDNSLNLRGNVVPFSVINSIVNHIPIVGNLLTGGRHGGIIAVSYSITGDLSDPQIFINPMSVLAPGVIRSILFDGGLTQ